MFTSARNGDRSLTEDSFPCCNLHINIQILDEEVERKSVGGAVGRIIIAVQLDIQRESWN